MHLNTVIIKVVPFENFIPLLCGHLSFTIKYIDCGTTVNVITNWNVFLSIQVFRINLQPLWFKFENPKEIILKSMGKIIAMKV